MLGKMVQFIQFSCATTVTSAAAMANCLHLKCVVIQFDHPNLSRIYKRAPSAHQTPVACLYSKPLKACEKAERQRFFAYTVGDM